MSLFVYVASKFLLWVEQQCNNSPAGWTENMFIHHGYAFITELYYSRDGFFTGVSFNFRYMLVARYMQMRPAYFTWIIL